MGCNKLYDWLKRSSYQYPPKAYYGEDYQEESYYREELGKFLARNNGLGFTF